jgi:hypothetical protein
MPDINDDHNATQQPFTKMKIDGALSHRCSLFKIEDDSRYTRAFRLSPRDSQVVLNLSLLGETLLRRIFL